MRNSSLSSQCEFVVWFSPSLSLFLPLLYDYCLPEKQFAMKATATIELIDAHNAYAVVCSHPFFAFNAQCLIYPSIERPTYVCMWKEKEKATRARAYVHTQALRPSSKQRKAALYAFVWDIDRGIERERKKERENKRRERASNVSTFASLAIQHTQTHTSTLFTSKLAPRLLVFLSTSVALFSSIPAKIK